MRGGAGSDIMNFMRTNNGFGRVTLHVIKNKAAGIIP